MSGNFRFLESIPRGVKRNEATVAIIISLISVCISVWIACQQERAANDVVMRDAISRYLATYSEVLKDGTELNPEGFKRLDWRDQRRVEILNGLLVSVVDAMYEAGDKRAALWAGYLARIDGPIANGFELEAYASRPETLAVIQSVRQRITQP